MSQGPREPSQREEEGAPPPAKAPRDPWLRFAATFAVFAIASELFYYGAALESPVFQSYLATVARISGWILGAFVDDVSVSAANITNPLFNVNIDRGCDAYRICALLTSAIIAFPAPIRTKVVGLFLGLLWLNFLNFFRIISLIFIGGYMHQYFQDSHEIYFPIFLVCMTVAAWIVFVRWATRDGYEFAADQA